MKPISNKQEMEKNLQELWDAIKRNNICMMAISEGKEKGTGIIFKAVMVKNFPHLGREMDILDL